MILESKIIRFFILIYNFIKKDFKNSFFNKVLLAIASFIERLLSGSFMLSFFSKESRHYINFNGMKKQGVVMQVIDSSIMFKLLDFINRFYLIEIFFISSMVFLPTKFSLVLAVALIINSGYKMIRNGGFINISHIMVLLFAIILLLSGFTGIGKGDVYLVTTIYSVYIISSFAMMVAMKDKKCLVWILVALVFVMAICSLYGFYQYFIGGVNIDPAWIDEEMFGKNTKRIYSFFKNPNVYGIFLVMILPISLSLVFYFKNIFVKLIFLGIFMAGVINVAFTMSRGSMISLLVAIYIMLIFIDRRFIVLGLLGLFVLPFVLPKSVIYRIMSIGNLKDSSSAYRISIYLATLNMIKDFLFTGIGLGSFKEVYHVYAFSASKSFHAHNTYLMVLVEEGLLGIITYLSIILAMSKETISYFINNKSRYRYLVIACFSGIMGASVQAIFEHIWHNFDIMFIYFVILLAGVSLTKKLTERKE